MGDTVLLTERLFYKERSNIAATAPSSNSTPTSQGNNNGIAAGGEKGANGVKSIVGGRTATGGKGREGNGVNVSAEGLGLGQGLGGGRSILTATVRMDLSVTSLQGQGLGSVRRRDEGYSDGPVPGSFMGERTIAAYVIKDNYRSVRDEVSRAGVSPYPRDAGRFGKYRRCVALLSFLLLRIPLKCYLIISRIISRTYIATMPACSNIVSLCGGCDIELDLIMTEQ